VNVTLKSGTNDWHGSAYLFNRVSATGAKNVFAVSKSPTVFNQFGGTLGGLIRRDKTFFFVSYQEIRDRRGDVTRATIPTPDFRQGNLSAAPTNIYDPNTGSSDGKGRTQFGNNVIPASRISPVAQGILTLVPQPTSSGLVTNYERATVRKKDTKSLDFKIDHLLRETDQFSVRYSLQQPEIFDPSLFGIYGGPKSGGFAGLGTQRAQNGAVNYAHIFSPLFMAEFRIGIMRYRNDAKNEDVGKRTAEELGIPVEVRSGDRPPSHRLAAVERDLLLDLDRHDVLTVQEIDWTESSDVETISFPVWTAPQAPPQSQPKRCKRRCKTTLIFGAAFVAAGTAMAVLINDPPCGQAPYYPCPVGVRNMPRKVGIGVAILGGAMIVSGVTSGRE
jgi:hypothetical protein